MFFSRRFRFGGFPPGEEHLDSPPSNFDVIGIPTGAWSTSIFACNENIVPSCVLSFFCPCVMWAQIVVRAQIPLLIGLKNTFKCMQTHTGYGAFIDYFMISATVVIVFIILLVALASTLSNSVRAFFFIVAVSVGATLIYLLQNTRRAFREKYTLPGLLTNRAACYWEQLWDGLIMIFCLPCALGQMARHVFQYDHMDAPLGLYFSDPSILPPLRPTAEQQEQAIGGIFERPAVADLAGLGLGRAHYQRVAAAHHQQAMEARQRQEIMRDATLASAPPTDYNYYSGYGGEWPVTAEEYH